MTSLSGQQEIRSAIRLAGAAMIAMAWIATAQAAECPRSDALGTSRVLTVDAATTPRVGLKSFPQSLPLEDHEVVLTFDDGPRPPSTQKVLAALAKECVHATFFLVGMATDETPSLVKRIVAEGHTIGHHSWSHRSMIKIPENEVRADIDKGIASDEKALNGKASTIPTTPFFRFPGFESRPETLDWLQSRGIVVFGADFWASDWEAITPEQVLANAIRRLEAAHKGIILLHDAQARTAAIVPQFLQYLKDNHYRVVHVVPAVTAALTASH
jgi:peptidoglycan/xylan/chitin deacetylase (PgdA/CDA1 family)